MSFATRQNLITKYRLHEHFYDHVLNEFIATIAAMFDVPSALLTVADGDTLWFKAKFGVKEERTARQGAFCNFVIEQNTPIVLEDISQDAFFSSNTFAKNKGIQFFTGVPFILEDVAVGSLCILDTKPRGMSKQHVAFLERLSQHMSQCISLISDHVKTEEESHLLNLNAASLIRWQMDPKPEITFVSDNFSRFIGQQNLQQKSGHQLFMRAIHKADFEQFAFTLNNHKQGVPQCECEYRLISDKGQVTWVKHLSSAFFDDTGKLLAVQAVIFDNGRNHFMQQKLLSDNKQMRTLIAASGLGTWDWHVEQDINQVNTRWCEMFGLNPDQFDTSIRFWESLIHPADRVHVLREMRQYVKQGEGAFNCEYRMRHSDGHWVWVEGYGRIIEKVGDKVTRAAGTLRDITDRKVAEIKEQRNHDLLLFINRTQTLFLQEQDLRTACSMMFDDMLEVAQSEFGLLGQCELFEGQPSLLIHAITNISWSKTTDELYELFEKGQLRFTNLENLFGHVVTSGEIVIANDPHNHPASRGTPEGHPFLRRFMGLPIKLKGETLGMIGLANKATDYTFEDANFLQPLIDTLGAMFYAVEAEKARKQAENKLKTMAQTDALTGLANRRAFIGHITKPHSFSHPIGCIAIIDIDHFKQINDKYGHHIGDIALVFIANILKDAIRSDDFIARLGGEEFGLLLSTKSKNYASKLLNKLRQTIETTPLKAEKHRLSITVSIGASLTHPDDNGEYSTFEHDMKRADRALYHAKDTGRNKLSWQGDEQPPSP